MKLIESVFWGERMQICQLLRDAENLWVESVVACSYFRVYDFCGQFCKLQLALQRTMALGTVFSYL